MGLDMYAYSVPRTPHNEQFDFPHDIGKEEFCYWRKFNALHGWMEERARERGFEGEFNVTPFRLDLELLDRLEKDIEANALKPVNGFFFGAQEIHPDDVQKTIQFIDNARRLISEGMDIYYDSWY